MHQHSWPPKRNDGPFSIYTSHLKQTHKWKEWTFHSLSNTRYTFSKEATGIKVLTNRTMMATGWFIVVALPTKPYFLICWITDHGGLVWSHQWGFITCLLIDCRPPIWWNAPRIRQNNIKVAPQQHHQLHNQINFPKLNTFQFAKLNLSPFSI